IHEVPSILVYFLALLGWMHTDEKTHRLLPCHLQLSAGGIGGGAAATAAATAADNNAQLGVALSFGIHTLQCKQQRRKARSDRHCPRTSSEDAQMSMFPAAMAVTTGR